SSRTVSSNSATGPAHPCNAGRNSLLRKELQPASLAVLQLVAGPLHFNQAIVAGGVAQRDQVGKSAPVLARVEQHALPDGQQVLARYAGQHLCKQVFRHQRPADPAALVTPESLQRGQQFRVEVYYRELRQAGVEQVLAALVEPLLIHVGGNALGGIVE